MKTNVLFLLLLFAGVVGAQGELVQVYERTVAGTTTNQLSDTILATGSNYVTQAAPAMDGDGFLRTFVDGSRTATEAAAELGIEKGGDVTAAIENLVEAKRMREIGRETIAEVDRKVRAIKRPDGVSVRTALVYDGHLSPLAASDGYFDAIVPFGKLLGLPQR